MLEPGLVDVHWGLTDLDFDPWPLTKLEELQV